MEEIADVKGDEVLWQYARCCLKLLHLLRQAMVVAAEAHQSKQASGCVRSSGKKTNITENLAATNSDINRYKVLFYLSEPLLYIQ